MKDRDPFIYYFHEDDNYTEAAAKAQNIESGYGEHKWKVRPYISKIEFDKLKHYADKLAFEVETFTSLYSRNFRSSETMDRLIEILQIYQSFTKDVKE